MIASHPLSRGPHPCRPGRFLLRVLLVSLAAWGMAESTLPAAEPPADPEYLVTLYDIEHGLPENSATAIVQTPDGCLWFSTWGGLARFDGREFESFSRLEMPQLPSSQMVNLHLDHDGHLWISTMRGMVCVKDQVCTPPGPASGWVGDYVRTFAEGPSQQLYVSTFSGRLMRVHGERLGGAAPIFEELPLPPGSNHEGLYPHLDASGELWIVTPYFIGRLSTQEQEATIPFLGRRTYRKWEETIPVSTWADEEFLGMASGREGALWIITKQRVRKYQGTRLLEQWKGTLTKFGVWQAREDSHGALWIATMADGLHRLSPDGHWRHLRRENGLPTNEVRTVFEDREGTIWAGTNGGGLLSLRPRVVQTWTAVQKMPQSNVLSVTADRAGRIYAGLLSEGVACLEGNTISRVGPPGQKTPWLGSATAVLMDHKGRLWVGMTAETQEHPSILHVIDGKKYQAFDPDQVGSFFVSSLMEDSHGRIWIGTGDGAVCFDGRVFHSYPFPEGPSNGALCLTEDPQGGGIWGAASLSGGLFYLRGDRFVKVAEVPATREDRYSGLLAEPDGTLWFGSERTGTLHCLRNGRLHTIKETNGLPALHALYPIITDESGNLWIGTDRGILRLPRDEVEAVLRGQKQELSSQLFTKEDGLPTKDCTAPNQPLAAKDNEGRLWFATVKGLVMVDPRRFQINPAPPVVSIDKVLRDGIVASSKSPFLTSSPPQLGPVIIPPGSGRLEIHYTGLSLSGPNSVRYKYMLEGIDKDWLDVGDHQVAYVQPLSPGTYSFHVKAANNHGVWNEQGTTLVLVAQPFYWQTLWFQTLVLICLMGSAGLFAWGFTRGRLRRQIERLQQQRILAREQARLASVLEATSDLVAFLDAEGNVLYLNPAGRRMAGLYAEAGLKGLKVSGLHPPWATERILTEGIPTAIREGTWSGETAILRENGGEVPLSQVIAAHRASDGTVSFLSTIARDMSERKQAELQLRGSLREKEALLKEIHHRVKNNLQIINSLLAIQAAQVQDPVVGELLTESQNRVRTMALVHENLYRAGNFASIPLAAHVEGLCAHLFGSFGAAARHIDLQTRIDDVSLDLDRAIPCGLIINELVSNALKYAFPGASRGRVRVEFKALPEGWYQLVVADDGIGLPAGLDPLRAQTMGLQLVSDLTEQLGGTLTVDRTGGTTFTLRFHVESPGGPQP